MEQSFGGGTVLRIGSKPTRYSLPGLKYWERFDHCFAVTSAFASLAFIDTMAFFA